MRESGSDLCDLESVTTILISKMETTVVGVFRQISGTTNTRVFVLATLPFVASQLKLKC